ncbi:MAG: MBOAT family protein [Actinobacteria bacterium]|nr:MAG: MBOAT family protein [Actinomycetota bacterium]
MQFASLAYMLFLALTVAVYFALPGQRSRTLWLLGASYFFYFTLSGSWTLVLIAVTTVGYVGGRWLEAPAAGNDSPLESRRTRVVLGASIALVVGILFVFKYLAFAGGVLNSGLSLFRAGAQLPLITLALPIGISFWTFQTIAYLVDVARGSLPAERDLARYAVFIAFFPHVAAGPIARGSQLLPQLAGQRRFSFEGMRSGLLLMLWGFFKKALVADRLAVFVAAVFKDPHAYADSGLVLAAASVGFAVQIYCDFSGYTDIARGAARIFGVDLLKNFNRPYAARSIKEFWRRWHMSLMGWLRDYVYIPLGGSRVSRSRRYANIIAVFALSGLWHGAGLTFLFWGLLNGCYQIFGELTEPIRERVIAAARIERDGRVHRVLQTVTTFVLVTVGWVFFRADSLADAFYIVPRMFVPTAAFLQHLSSFKIGLDLPEVALTAIAATTVFAVDYLSAKIDLPSLVYRQPVVVRWAFYQLATLVVLVFGAYGPSLKSADFVYFKF